MKHHQAGDLAEAVTLYRQILEEQPRHGDALHLLGVAANQLGDTTLAIQLIGQALQINPLATEYHNNLGNAYKSCGQLALAEDSYRRAILHNKENAQAYINLGSLFEAQGRKKEAKGSYRDALQYSPGMLAAYMGLGGVAAVSGDLEEALAQYRHATRSHPLHAPAHRALGNALCSAGDLVLARQSYLRALEIDPGYADAHYNLGNLYLAQEDYGHAIGCYRLSIQLDPSQADVHNFLGLALFQTKDFGRSILCFLRAIELNPVYAEAYYNLGNALADSGDHAHAIACMNKAIQISPDYGKAHHNLGVYQQALGKLEEATAAYRQALSYESGNQELLGNLGSVLALQGKKEGLTYLKQVAEATPDSTKSHFDLATALLLHGDFLRGWQEYAWRWKWDKFTSPRRNFSQPEWNGEPLHGASILLHAEQGFGDTLQFARYAPLVECRGGRVILEVQPELCRLLQSVPGVALCLARGEPLPEFQWHIPLMSLPLVFETTAATIPAAIPYSAPAYSGLRKEDRTVNVGIVWAGNPRHVHDKLRSVPLHLFQSLAHIKNVTLRSLQKGPATLQQEQRDAPFVLLDACSTIKDFADTAAIIADLDLVISVDTSVAHLAATMGKPTWILISHAPEWRWGLHAETTPWYPSARLFRRGAVSGWEEVIERVASALITFAANKELQGS